MPKKELGCIERDTLHRQRFFDAYDRKLSTTSFRSLCRREGINIPESTGRLWLKNREDYGSDGIRRCRKLSTRLGRKSKISEAALDRLIDQKDPVHAMSVVNQIKELHLNCHKRTLQRNAMDRRNAKHYKKRPVTALSQKNKDLRVQYGRNHQGKTITGFWQNVYFTDEAHFQTADLAYKSVWETRQPGAEPSDQLQPIPQPVIDLTVHVAGGVSYNHKGPLIFYNDPAEPGPKVYKPRKPRKSSVQSDDDYQAALQAWQEVADHDVVVQWKGNSMTQRFYTDSILPKHIEHIQWLQTKYNHRIFFQEDNDGARGTRSLENIARRAKTDAGLTLLTHPAQSPDLNPIEAIWMIIKERLRGGRWNSVQEFKDAIEAEWRQVTQAQIRRRIREMPIRCKYLVDNQGARYKSNSW